MRRRGVDERGVPASGGLIGAEFLRFVLVGGASNVVYALVFVMLGSVGTFSANAVGVVVSSALANELHRRHTFRAAARVHWLSAQWEGGGLALLGLVVSTVSLALLDVWLPVVDDLARAATVIAVSGAVGVMRYVGLRSWVFSAGRRPALRIRPDRLSLDARLTPAARRVPAASPRSLRSPTFAVCVGGDETS